LALLRRFVPVSFVLGALLVGGCKDPSPTTGTLIVSITGLPAGASAAVRVTGPNLFNELIGTSRTFENLEPGDYVVRSDTITVANTRYGVVVVRDTITIIKGRTETATVPYQVASGSLTMTIDGLPPGTPADVRLIGPGHYGTITSAGTVSRLVPGKYLIIADTMTTGLGDRFLGINVLDSVMVPASLTPAQANVTYTLVSGTLDVTVTGLPGSIDPLPITVTGPGGFQRKAAQSTVMRGLAGGSYTITAVKANGVCPFIYTTAQSQQTRDVTIGSVSTASVAYTEGQAAAADLNLKIDGVHLIQVTQDYAGTVPMLSNKPALLRVFGVANQCNTARPKVRVTLSTGTVFNIDMNSGEQSVRLSPDQSTLVSSWNVTVPANHLQPGLTVVAEIDPDNAVAEANESDNRFPASGARAVDVKVAPTVGLRLVPVTQGNLTGSAPIEAFMELSTKLHPVGIYDVDVRLPYTTSLGALSSGGNNWGALLGEIRNLRTTDTSNRHYYGVVKVSYTSGVAGVAYVPGFAGLGWDYQPSGGRVMAHELGHNFGRAHTPCGGPAGVDPNYPNTGNYVGGYIGVYGFDMADGTLKASNIFTDVMGYCNNQWISDYTYVGMMSWLTDPNRAPTLPTAGSTAVQPSLLIWGRIVNGQPVLEPTFEISARPQMPARAGSHRLAALDANGAELFSFAFAGERIADLPGEHENFTFAVPLSALRGRALGSMRLTARGRTVSATASSDVAAEPEMVMSRSGPRAVRLQWNASRFPVVMVRDPATGQVLSFARGGDVTIVTDRSELDLNYSNRLRSTRALTRIR
jgi:hypothetical protein